MTPSNTSDLVERLRFKASEWKKLGAQHAGYNDPNLVLWLEEAAARISALEKALKLYERSYLSVDAEEASRLRDDAYIAAAALLNIKDEGE